MFTGLALLWIIFFYRIVYKNICMNQYVDPMDSLSPHGQVKILGQVMRIYSRTVDECAHTILSIILFS